MLLGSGGIGGVSPPIVHHFSGGGISRGFLHSLELRFGNDDGSVSAAIDDFLSSIRWQSIVTVHFSSTVDNLNLMTAMPEKILKLRDL